MKKVNIFVDCHVFDGNFQGTTTYIKGLYSELIKDKHYRFFLGANDIASLESIFGTHDNVVYVRLKATNKFIRLLFEIPAIIKNHQIDYAHFQYVVPPIKKCKYILTIHDVLFLDFPEYFPITYRLKNRFLFGKSAKCSEIVLSVSEYSKKQLQKHFGIDTVTVTPNAVDPVFFEPYDKAAVQAQVRDKFKISKYFLFVSRWEPRKNHYRLLKAFVEKGYYTNYNMVFVGDKAIENKEYTVYFKSLPQEIKSKIFTFNKVSFNELLLFVRGADLSIYPSVAEGFGIPPLESLAAGVPTICSNTTAMSDFSFLNECLFNPLDIQDLKDKIEIGLNDSKINQKREAMAHKFSWDQAAEEFKRALY
ncbi:glycosyltransferase family 4 protein [Flavobacterium sp.]